MLKKNEFSNKIPKSYLIAGVGLIVAIVSMLFFISYKGKMDKKRELDIQQNKANGQTDTKQTTQDILNKICINEISSEGFIELYNTGNSIINISEFKLSVGNDDNVIVADNTFILANGYHIIEIDGAMQGNCIITLCDDKENIVQRINVPELKTGESYGRKTDGNIYFSKLVPSKESTNSNSEIILDNTPIFSLQGGFYEDELFLDIYANEDCTIYYTTDGSVPTIESNVYSEPIRLADVSGNKNVYSANTNLSSANSWVPTYKVDKCNVIKAIAVDSTGKISDVVTESYFFDLNNDAIYTDIPMVSIVSEPTGLFDYYEGNYVAGKLYDDSYISSSGSVDTNLNCTQGWQRSATIEFYEADRSLSYKTEAQMNVHIDWAYDCLQKSLKFSSINNTIESDSVISNFINSDSILFSVGGEDYSFKMSDAFLQEMASELNIYTFETQPCQVFLDGEYWGVYLLKEEFNSYYISKKYGIDKENINVVKNGLTVDGDNAYTAFKEMYDYIAGNDMSIDVNYERAQELIDIESYIDWYCTQIYTGNVNISSEYIYAWQSKVVGNSEYEDGKWRFALNTNFGSMGLSDLSGYRMNTFLAENVQNDLLFNSLLKSNVFKEQFLNRFLEIGNDYFSENKAREYIAQFTELYKSPMREFYYRFGAGNGTTYETYFQKIQNYFSNRSKYIYRGMLEYLGLENEYSVVSIIYDNTSADITINDKQIIKPATYNWYGYFKKSYMLNIKLVGGDKNFGGWHISGSGNYIKDDLEVNITLEDFVIEIECLGK